MKVQLQKVIDAIESTNEETNFYYNPATEEIAILEPDVSDIKDSYIFLPSQRDRHDYEIMEDYIYEVEDDTAKEWLTNAIHGRGAFRMFRATVDRFGLTSDWYDFRENAYRELAIQWCNDNGIEFAESQILYDEEAEEEYIEPATSLPDLRVISINKKNVMNILYMVADKNVFVNSLHGIHSSKDLEYAEEEVSSILNENTYVFAASLNGKLLGYAVTLPLDNHLLLDTIFVRKEDRRQGIGSMLLEHAEKLAEEENLPLMFHVSPNNEYYINYLKKKGYAYIDYLAIKKN